VRIPAGVDDGQRIRLKGRGAPGRNGGPPGDLFVDCRVTAHPVFSRDGLNLVVNVPVAYHEAVLGAEVDVPTLDGAGVKLKIKSGTQSGTKHRVKGRGIATDSKSGDLIVTVEVAVPTKLSDDERDAIEKLAEVAANPRASGSRSR
jgi:molecular chaperone DnaJ